MTPSRLIIFAALLAAALKCAWAASSFGTNDTVVFFLFGAGLTERGLVELYDVPMFNHTPLVGTYIEAIYGWANRDLILTSFAPQWQLGHRHPACAAGGTPAGPTGWKPVPPITPSACDSEV